MPAHPLVPPAALARDAGRTRLIDFYNTFDKSGHRSISAAYPKGRGAYTKFWNSGHSIPDSEVEIRFWDAACATSQTCPVSK